MEPIKFPPFRPSAESWKAKCEECDALRIERDAANFALKSISDGYKILQESYSKHVDDSVTQIDNLTNERDEARKIARALLSGDYGTFPQATFSGDYGTFDGIDQDGMPRWLTNDE